MCSKNAEPGAREVAVRRAGAPARGADSRGIGFPVTPLRGISGSPAGAPSITWRLTLLYLVSTAALLLLAGGFLYWTLNRSLDISRRGLMANKIEVLRILLQEQPQKADALASEVEHEASASHLLKYYLRILDEQAHVRLETTGMKDLLPVSRFPAPKRVAAEALDSIEPVSVRGRSFLLLSVQVPVGATGQEQWTLQVGLDISSRVALMAEYRGRMLMTLGVGLVFAAVAGVWVARQGMRPLVEITQAAQHITASQLHERIAGRRWPAELAELASAFDAMLDRLENSFTRLSQFSADLAHELRTPINNLRGEAEVALTCCSTLEEHRQILVSSLEEYERLSRMIDGLLFLARADNPHAAVERVRFDAGKEIEAIREFYEALAAEQGVGVVCEGNAWLIGDPLLFRRAISNLLANALRHTPANGNIHISIHSRDDAGVEVSVRDTGAGIAPEHLPKIFDRFYRADDARTQTPGGSGLGLAIVQSIMCLHEGTASIQSCLGQGTTVTLRFPATVPVSTAGK